MWPIPRNAGNFQFITVDISGLRYIFAPFAHISLSILSAILIWPLETIFPGWPLKLCGPCCRFTSSIRSSHEKKNKIIFFLLLRRETYWFHSYFPLNSWCNVVYFEHATSANIYFIFSLRVEYQFCSSCHNY